MAASPIPYGPWVVRTCGSSHIAPPWVSWVRVQTILFTSTPSVSYTRPWYMAGVTKSWLKN